jgi:hypothetical protein
MLKHHQELAIVVVDEKTVYPQNSDPKDNNVGIKIDDTTTYLIHIVYYNFVDLLTRNQFVLWVLLIQEFGIILVTKDETFIMK